MKKATNFTTASHSLVALQSGTGCVCCRHSDGGLAGRVANHDSHVLVGEEDAVDVVSVSEKLHKHF